jgi:subtilisin-like proprotein convertase family protein
VKMRPTSGSESATAFIGRGASLFLATAMVGSMVFGPIDQALPDTSACRTAGFSSLAAPAEIPDDGVLESTLEVPASKPVHDLEVHVDIRHPFDSDLVIELVAPSGKAVILAENVGLWGDDFVQTTFDDEAPASIISALPPYKGRFRPSQKLSAFHRLDGMGEWMLRISDKRSGYVGALEAWAMSITTCDAYATPTDGLVQRLPQCGPIGATPLPHLPEGVPEESEPAVGTLVMVANSSDLVTGDTSSVPKLMEDPGVDGISLREAIEATNNDPGTFTVRFESGLKDATIAVGSSDRDDFPALTGGGVFIDGDINGDGTPDITIADAAGRNFGLRIASSHNRLHALTIRGFRIAAVLFDNVGDHKEYANNTLTGLDTDAQIVLQSGVSQGAPHETHNSWLATRIIGNTLRSEIGVTLNVAFVVDDRVEHFTIANNRFEAPSHDVEVENNAINLEPGFGIGSTGNVVRDGIIAYNSITPSSSRDEGIRLGAGGDGGSGNIIEDIRIVSNDVGMEPGGLSGFTSKNGISVLVGESHIDFPVPYEVGPAHDNVARRISVIGNNIHGQNHFGIRLIANTGGGWGNRIQDVTVSGNVIRGSLDPESLNPAGIFVSGGSGGGDIKAAENLVTNVSISNNSVFLDSGERDFAYLQQGGIAVIGGESVSSSNRVTGVSIRKNRVRTELIAISLIGGWALPDQASTRNEVSHVKVACNVAPVPPFLVRRDVPKVKGVNLTGGAGALRDDRAWIAKRNKVFCIKLKNNLVEGRLRNSHSIYDNLGHGALNNVARLNRC